MRILALDVGDKYIGVAISDELLITARGLTTIERVGIRKDTGKVIDLITEHSCGTVVVGLPINLNGTESIQTKKVIEFRDMLANKLRSTGMQNIAVVYQDERFTTVIAERVLIEADLSRKKRKKIIDKQAAAIILQSYLDRLAVENKADDASRADDTGNAGTCMDSAAADIGAGADMSGAVADIGADTDMSGAVADITAPAAPTSTSTV
jgi:putative Holliday junction resolvase